MIKYSLHNHTWNGFEVSNTWLTVMDKFEVKTASFTKDIRAAHSFIK